MAFKDILFPPQISYGASGGPEFSTDVIIIASGMEKRNSNWQQPRYKFEVAHGVKTQDQLDELIAFFYQVQGRRDSFRFKNWMEFEIFEETSLVKETETPGVFQLCKSYGGGKYKKLTKIVEDTLVVYKSGAVTTAYTVDINTGLITIAGPANTITFTCEYDMHCRFNTDRMWPRIDNYNIYSWDQIELIEVKDAN